jgi:hypothetical protein
MRGEVKLAMYSFEAVVAAVLRLRVPHVSQQQLAAWFNGGPAGGLLPPMPTCVKKLVCMLPSRQPRAARHRRVLPSE